MKFTNYDIYFSSLMFSIFIKCTLHIYLVSFTNYPTWLYLNLCPLFTSSSHFYAISDQFLNCDSTVNQGYSVFSIYVRQYILQ